MNTLTIAALAAIGALLVSCGGAGGGAGGFGGAPQTPGGAVDSGCGPAIHHQGCTKDGAKAIRVQCTVDPNNAQTGKWKKIGDCADGEVCGVKKENGKDVAFCKKPDTSSSSGASSGGASSGGTSSGGRSSGGTSSGGTSSGGTSSGGTSSGGTSSGGTPTPDEIITCAKTKCAAQWGACEANAKCKAGMECAVKCKLDDSACISKCWEGADQAVGQLQLALGGCMIEKKCAPDPNQTGPKCGNGKCEKGETPTTCAADCKTTGPKCGNEKCEDGETPATCPADCKKDGPKCGNGTCEDGETNATCPADCKPDGPKCGNGKCETGETPSTCPADCKTTTDTCGDLVCQAPKETKTSCGFDCDPQVSTVMKCAQGKCSSEYGACMSDTGCKAAMVCVGNCGQNQSCAVGCQSKAGSGVAKAQALATCLSNKCVDSGGGCKSAMDCNSGEKCVDGTCIKDSTPECKADSDCTGGKKCVGGKCTGGTTTGGTCKLQGCKYDKKWKCQCDDQCKQFKDCCPDKDSVCPVAGGGSSSSSSGGSSSSSSSSSGGN